MVSMSNIGFNLAGGLSALGSLGCLFNTASVVTKAIKGDGQPTSFQRLLNNTFGEAQTKASETGRQALEAVAWGASALLLAGISWTCVDTSELSFPSFSDLFSPSDTGPDDCQGGGDVLGTMGDGVKAAFTAAAGAAGAATNTTLEFVAENPGTSAGLGFGGAAALGTAAAAKAAGGIGAAAAKAAGGVGAAAGAAAGAVKTATGALAGAAMDAAGKAGAFFKKTPTAVPVPDAALGGAAS